MKITLQFEGDSYEDANQIKELILANHMACIIFEAKELVRNMLKYGIDSQDQLTRRLEELMEVLWIEGIAE